MTIREWALLALAVIAGVPLYALVAGWTARAGLRVPLDCEFHRAGCPRGWYGNGRPCDCGADALAAAILWPVVLFGVTVFRTVRALLFLPARAAYRAALRGGDPKCPGPDCGGCQPWEPKP